MQPLFKIISVITIVGLLLPSISVARERQDHGRDIDRDNASVQRKTDTGTVSVQNSVIISTRSGDNEADHDDVVQTGDENAYVHVETTVNGETVQSIVGSGDDETNVAARSHRSDRSHIYEDRSRGIRVETEIEGEVIVEDVQDTGNQTNDGEDGRDGSDGTDGQDGNSVNYDDSDETVEEEEDDTRATDRRERGERNVDHRNMVATSNGSDMWSRITNFFNHVFAFIFV